MKKILFIHNTLNAYRIPLFRLLSKKYDVTYLITREKKEKFEQYKDLNCERLPYIFIFSRYGLAWTIPFKLLFKKTDLIIANDPHVFETHIAFLISKLRRKKFVLWSETFDWPRTPKSKIMEIFIKLMLKNTDSCIALGTKAKEYFMNRGVAEEKIFIAPDTAETLEILNHKQNLKELEEKVDFKGKKVVLYMSRIVPYKGLDYLVKAFAKLRKEENAVLLIGGEGPFKTKIEKLVEQQEIEDVHFLGWVDKDKTGFMYSISDVFVLPSLFRDYDAECWGLVLNEAMALGKPVISTDEVGSAYDLIQNGENGYMVKARDTEELYKSLKKILSDSKLREKMGQKSKEIIQKSFTYEKMAKGFEEAIEIS